MSAHEHAPSFDDLVEETVLEQGLIDDELIDDEAREIVDLVETAGHADAAARKFGDSRLYLRHLAEDGSALSSITEDFFVEENRMPGDSTNAA